MYNAKIWISTEYIAKHFYTCSYVLINVKKIMYRPIKKSLGFFGTSFETFNFESHEKAIKDTNIIGFWYDSLGKFLNQGEKRDIDQIFLVRHTEFKLHKFKSDLFYLLFVVIEKNHTLQYFIIKTMKTLGWLYPKSSKYFHQAVFILAKVYYSVYVPFRSWS